MLIRPPLSQGATKDQDTDDLTRQSVLVSFEQGYKPGTAGVERLANA